MYDILQSSKSSASAHNIIQFSSDLENSIVVTVNLTEMVSTHVYPYV